MFSVLHAHEEREPKAVLKTQSKRAQKRLLKAELRKEERGHVKSEHWNAESEHCPWLGVGHEGGQWATTVRTENETAAAQLYEELFADGDVDPALLEDIAVQMQQMQLGCQSGRSNNGACRNNRPAEQRGGSPFSYFPPGPGPGHTDAPTIRSGQVRLAGRSWSQPLSPQAFQCSPWDGSECSSGSSRPSTSSSSIGTGAYGVQPQRPAPMPAGPREDFPELRAAPARTAWSPATCSIKGGRGSGQQRGGSSSRNGHSSAVKVLHAARPVQSPTHECGDMQPSGSGDLDGGRGGGPGELNLGLLWELLQGGMSLLPDPLAEAEQQGGDLERIGPDACAAIRRLVAAQCAEGDGSKPARGVSQEDMIAMMSRAHNRQVRGSSSAAAAEGGSSDDEAHYYGREIGDREIRSWRRTVDWMEKNDWVRVTDTDGKHYKYRRLLPNGQIQTQTVCCSPSDALRGVRNLQADLARKDAEANAIIREWRKQQRQCKVGT